MIVNIALIAPRLLSHKTQVTAGRRRGERQFVVCLLPGWVVSSPLQSSLAQWLIHKTQLGGSQLKWWLLSTGRQNGQSKSRLSRPQPWLGPAENGDVR